MLFSTQTMPPVTQIAESTKPPRGQATSPQTQRSIAEAYRFCKELATHHYENFPVGSLFTPPVIRSHIHAIYAFARIADDYADEGNIPSGERLNRLDDWQQQLDNCFQGRASHPVFVALAHTVRQLNIPQKPFNDLLVAFRMDVTRNRYEHFDDLLFYCDHSANPIGRLVLLIWGVSSTDILHLSDQFCTGLQLANFWQDISVDLHKDRIYIPLEDFRRFGYTEHQLREGETGESFRNLLQFQVSRTKEILTLARPLLKNVGGGLRRELALTWHGGTTILEKIEAGDFDTLSTRPRITAFDKLRILLGMLMERR